MKNCLKKTDHQLIYGSKIINYKLLYSKRKTMEIAVHPDCSVIVKATIGTDILLIKRRLQKKARWVIKQMNYFGQFTHTPKRCYVSGETHLYLGRQYRLRILRGDKNSVKLIRGYFQITCRQKPTPEIIKKLLNKWYLEKASIQFNESLERCRQKFRAFALEKPEITIRKMKRRWGSLSQKKKMTLNSNLIKAPKECIDYVVFHELCHLKIRNHSRKFYELLVSVLPDWEKIKHKLEVKII